MKHVECGYIGFYRPITNWEMTLTEHKNWVNV